MPAELFGVVVVMPLAADCVPPGSVKSTVPPEAAADVSQAQEQRVRRARGRQDDGRTARIDRQAVEPLAVGRAGISLNRQGAAAQGQGRGIGRVVDDVGRRRAPAG